MSQENVEIIKAGIDAWNAGDMDRFRDMYDPNVVLHTVPDWPEPGPYVGRDAVMRLFNQVGETWESDAVEPLGELIEVADHVLVRHTYRGGGRGADWNIQQTIIFTLRKGRIIIQEYFWDQAETLKAVGLAE
jgi:ketosteroid isomerase-like protein